MKTIREALPQSKHLDALTWAADRAGMSYGRFVQTLSAVDRTRIYRQYQKHLDEKEKEKQQLTTPPQKKERKRA